MTTSTCVQCGGIEGRHEDLCLAVTPMEYQEAAAGEEQYPPLKRHFENTKTISARVPDETKARMDAYDWVKWSVVLRNLVEEHLDKLDRMSGDG